MNIELANREIEDVKLSPAKILFGAVCQTERDVLTSNEWNVTKNSMGLFFITGILDEKITKASIEILAEGNIRVWSSKIKALPQDSLIVNGVSENMYISSKVIQGEDLVDWGNGEYTVIVDCGEIQELKLKVSGFEENEPTLTNESLTSEEYILDDEDESNEEDLTNQEYILDDEDESNEEDLTNQEYILDDEDESNEEDLTNQEYILDDEDESNEEDLTDQDVSDEEFEEYFKKLKLDTKQLLVDFAFNNKPFAMHCYTANVLDDTAKKEDIIVEKNGEQYLVVVNNLLPRPIHLFDGDSPYFKFEGTINEFNQKIMKLICRNYGLNEQEFKDMSKLLILDKNTQEEALEDDFLRYTSREKAIEMIEPKSNEMVIDMCGNECNIIYKNSDDEIIKVSCYELSSRNKLAIYNDLNLIIRNVGIENVYLTGEASSTEIRKLLGVDVSEKFDSLAKLI